MAHLAEVEEAVSAVEGAGSLPVEVRSSVAAAVQELQLTHKQDAVVLEAPLRSVHPTRSLVRCAVVGS